MAIQHTSAYLLPYPQDEDPPDGPGQFKALADALDPFSLPSWVVAYGDLPTTAAIGRLICVMAEKKIYVRDNTGWQLAGDVGQVATDADRDAMSAHAREGSLVYSAQSQRLYIRQPSGAPAPWAPMAGAQDPLQLTNGLSVGGPRTTFHANSPSNGSATPMAEFIGKDTQSASFLTVRYAPFADNPGPTVKTRRAGISFKLSNELNAPESVKQFSAYVHSGAAYGNTPVGVLQADAVCFAHNAVTNPDVGTWDVGKMHWNSGWANGTYFTIGNTAADEESGVMLGNPHIPWRTARGARLRYAVNSAASHYWDAGVVPTKADAFTINRNGADIHWIDQYGNCLTQGAFFTRSGAGIFMSDDKCAIYSDSSYVRINETNAFPGGVFFGNSKVVVAGTGQFEAWSSAMLKMQGGKIWMGDGAGNQYGEFISWWTGEGCVAMRSTYNNCALRIGSRAYVTDSGGGAWAPISASAFNVNSQRASKQDIEPLLFSALDVLRDAPAYGYRFRPEKSIAPGEHVGPMVDDLPPQYVEDDGTVNLTDLIGLVWAAVRELSEKVEGTRVIQDPS